MTLNRVSYVPELRKNLVSIPVLTKNGFKCVFVSDKVEASKNDMYVGKGYLSDGLFKLNVIAVDMNKDFASSYLLESKCLWHERLGHVNNKTLRKLINLIFYQNLSAIYQNVKFVLNLSMLSILINLLKGIQIL